LCLGDWWFGFGDWVEWEADIVSVERMGDLKTINQLF
jgi:hypothetical protein